MRTQDAIFASRIGFLALAGVTSGAGMLAQQVSTLPVDQRQVNVSPATPANSEIAVVRPVNDTSAYQGPAVSTVALPREAIFHSSFALSSGHDTAVDDVPGVNGPVVLAEATGGLMIDRPRYSLLLEHDAKFTNSFHDGTQLQQYQQTTATFKRVLSHRTQWSALLQNEFGSDAARSSGRLSVSPLDQGASDLSSNGPGVPAGNTLSMHALGAVEHHYSQFRTVSFDAGSYYHRFLGLGTSGYQQNAGAAFSQIFSQRTIGGARVSAVRDTYEGTNCTTVAATLFASRQLQQNVRFEGSAGPAWSSAGCAGSYQYEALLSHGTSRGSLLYLSTSRRRSDGLAPGSTWENANSGGVVFGQTAHLQVRGSAGYASYEVAKAITAPPNLNGYFLSGELRHRLSSWSELSLTGRFLSRTATSSTFNRCVVLATYSWSREQRPTRNLVSAYGTRP